jgi:hypothetical protein
MRTHKGAMTALTTGRPFHIITMAMKAKSLTVQSMISNQSPSRVTRFH